MEEAQGSEFHPDNGGKTFVRNLNEFEILLFKWRKVRPKIPNSILMMKEATSGRR
jgi:hypothetical protein